MSWFHFQAEEVDLMIERMEEQVKQLTKAYREELTQIEVSHVIKNEQQHNKLAILWFC